ncbi:MAG: DUF3149 domain-containing protein [Microvirgula sp.]
MLDLFSSDVGILSLLVILITLGIVCTCIVYFIRKSHEAPPEDAKQ